MATFDPRDPRFRNPVPGAKPPSPLEQARAAGARPGKNLDPALRPLVENTVGAGVIGTGGSNVRAWHDQQMDALVPQMQEAVGQMPGALEAARNATQQSYDEQMRLARDYAGQLEKPQSSSILGRAGVALMQNTTTGSFGEAMGNAFGAAFDQRDKEKLAAAEREDRLYNTRLALARMQGEAPNSAVKALQDQVAMGKTINEVGSYEADMMLRRDLAAGLTPTDPAELVADAEKNPSKYMSPRGQQMIADARSRLSTASERQFELDKIEAQGRKELAVEREKALLAGNRSTPLDRAESNRVSKRLAEVQAAASDASGLKGDIAALQVSRNKTGLESMWFGDAYASAGQFFNAPGASELAEVRANAENLRLGLTSQLKGAISDKDMQLLGNATPGIGMEDGAANNLFAMQNAAADRAIERSQFLQQWVRLNGHDYGADEAWSMYTEQNPLFSQDKSGNTTLNKANVGRWRDYVVTESGQPAMGGAQPQQGQQGGGQGGQPRQGLLVDPATLPPNVQAWAERQLQNGIPVDEVIDYLNEKITQQGEQ